MIRLLWNHKALGVGGAGLSKGREIRVGVDGDLERRRGSSEFCGVTVEEKNRVERPFQEGELGVLFSACQVARARHISECASISRLTGTVLMLFVAGRLVLIFL